MSMGEKLEKTFLLISILTFFCFGFYHLTKFETVDEHFWKDKRIKKYWTGIKLGVTEGKWKKTRINDKPGVTVAIVSGTGLLFEPNPEKNRIHSDNITHNKLYTVYDSEQTEKINLIFRLPLLIFNSLFLIIIFWLLLKILPPPIPVLSIAFMATSPILVGISQIINPDTLLWTFFIASIISYFALLKYEQKKFLWLTIFFTGLAILSKYTANILFPIFVFIFISKLIFENKNTKFTPYFKKRIIEWFGILLGSILMYGIIMPASLEKTKHLWNGTIKSPALEMIFPFLLVFIIILLLETLLFKNIFSKKIIFFLRKNNFIFFKLSALIPLILFFFVLVNPYLSKPIIPLDDVKEHAFVEKELLFPMLHNYSFITKNLTKVAIEIQPFVFSLSPIITFLLLFLWLKIIIKDIKKNRLLIFFINTTIPLYFIMLLVAGVLANPRYSIILYPLISVLSALAIYEIFSTFKKNIYLIFVLLFIIGTGIFSLWNIKPFYLDYESFLLPKKYILTDAWGYGEYEAAKYLNSLPNPEKIIIWSDRSAICQFIKGKCIRNYKIDLSKTVPDYLVFSRRGSIRHKFQWAKEYLAPHNIFYYYKQPSVWEIHIDNRSKNFVRIIPFSP